MTAALVMTGVSMSYRDTSVLTDIDVEVGENETVAVLGSNGVGKTTLLRGIVGALHPKLGTIEYFGKSLGTTAPWDRAKRGISYVPQGRRCFAGLSVEENLLTGLSARLGKPSRREALAEIYEIFPVLAEKRTADSRNLSGGQQQMLAIGRGLIARPRLLLLDEPSLGLAPVLVDDLVAALIAVQHSYSMAVVLVEQNLEVPLACADRGYLLAAGSVRAAGKTADLAERVGAAYLGVAEGV
jgi:branched-chain amino acid transport system ATP-binding protein